MKENTHNIEGCKRKELDSMAVPVLMNYLVNVLFELTDQTIVSRYSTEVFAVVSTAGNLLYVVTGTLGILSGAYSILAARSYGSGEKVRYEQEFRIVCWAGIVLGIFSCIGGMILAPYLIGGYLGFTGTMLSDGVGYFRISSVTIGLNLLLFLFSAYFRNQHNTRISFYNTVVTTSVNLIVDELLVYGKFGLPELGAIGAAVGSVIGLCSGVLVYLIAYARSGFYKQNFQKCIVEVEQSENQRDDVSHRQVLKVKWSEQWQERVLIIKQIMQLFLPLMLQELLEGTIFAVLLTKVVTGLNVAGIAAYQVLESIGSMLVLPAYAYANAGVILAIQERESVYRDEGGTGSNKIVPGSHIILLACKRTVGIAAGVSIFICAFSKNVLGIMSQDFDVLDAAESAIIFMCAAQILNAIRQCLQAYLQGNGREKQVVRIIAVTSLSSIAGIFCFRHFFGVVGIYLGICGMQLIVVRIYYKLCREIV